MGQRADFPIPSGGPGRLCLLLVAAAALGGCRLVGGGRPEETPRPAPEAAPTPAPEREEPVPLPEGDLRGEILVEGEPMQAHLLLIPEGRGSLRGILEGPVDFRAEGPGTAQGTDLRLELSYGGDCPGSMTLEGTWDLATASFRGIIRASDCTGDGQGTFHFQRG